ncbi:MAG: ABC transporter permease [Clostridiales bacterium]|nr:ABC transporter permease [Clostridiales bacterium]
MIQTKRMRNDKAIERSLEITRKRSQWADIASRLSRSKVGMFGFSIVVILLILVIFAPLFTRHDPALQDLTNKFAPPGSEHLMGTDNFGRDLWSRLLYGGRISLLIAFFSTLLSCICGLTIGSISGYFGGKLDIIINRILDVMMAIPGLLLAIAISTALGSSPFNTVLAISVAGIPPSARLMRATVMSIKSNEYVEAAIATGSNNIRIILLHIIPNAIAPMLLTATMSIGGGIMQISGLSFLGLGVMPPTPEWGSILNAGRPFLRDFWPIIVFPAMFITLTVLGFNLFGDALRDALDPRLKD